MKIKPATKVRANIDDNQEHKKVSKLPLRSEEVAELREF
jgi:hypothetical protein